MIRNGDLPRLGIIVLGSGVGEEVKPPPVTDEKSLTENPDKASSPRQDRSCPIGMHVDHDESAFRAGAPAEDLNLPVEMGRRGAWVYCCSGLGYMVGG